MKQHDKTRRDFLRLAGAGAAAVAFGGFSRVLQAGESANPFAAPGRERPNVLLLLTDDQAFRTIGSLNNPQVETPNIDRLIRRGTTFTHCFNQGGFHGAICVASRAMLNTGRYLWTCGGDTCGDWPLWGETLGKAGYDTFMTGKWHNEAPALKRSFKTIGPTGGGMFPSKDRKAEEHAKQGILKDPYSRPAPGNSWSPSDESLEGHWRKVDGKTVHSSVLWADTAIDYLNRRAAGSSDPFFMYVAFHAPHDPRQSPAEFVDLYPPDKIEVPPNYLPEHPFDQGDHKLRDELLAPFPRTKEAVQVHLSEYYAIITHVDRQIGRVLDALDASGKADNTIVVLSADQGLAVGQHGLMGKQNQYDHSVRMPFVICGPGIEAGRKIDAMIYLQSLFATTCDMARIETPRTVQFPSLVPLLTGRKERLYDSIYGAYRNLQRMVRTERYKLIRYPHVNEVQLFDLQEDPWETKDLAEDPRYADTVRSLDEQLHRWMKETGDKLELDRL
ncbi:MAG: sulfatase-like hydrolase/transferase [Planctomycetes bacterium]|nr:sulfatase-like hydrolase/transferase [Planctomycetota bacterium]